MHNLNFSMPHGINNMWPCTLYPRQQSSWGQTSGPPGSCWPQMGPMLAPWTLLSGMVVKSKLCFVKAFLLAIEFISIAGRTCQAYCDLNTAMDIRDCMTAIFSYKMMRGYSNECQVNQFYSTWWRVLVYPYKALVDTVKPLYNWLLFLTNTFKRHTIFH